MKVLFVIDSLGLGGGAEHSIAELLPELRNRGVETALVCLRNREGGLQERLSIAGFPVTVLRTKTFWGRALELRRAIGCSSPDLVHATLSESCMLARLAVAGTRVPLVNSLVNNAFAYLEREGTSMVRMRRRAFAVADAVTGRLFVDRFHAVCHDVKSAYMRHLRLPGSRIDVVYRGRSRARLGEPSSERRDRVRRTLGIDDKTFVLLNVGRQDMQKGQVHLVRAMPEIVDVHSDTRLLIAGRQGTATDELLETISASDVSDRVTLLDHRDDVPDLLSASDVLLLPSVHEGLANTLIESMAMMVPIVATDIPGSREVLQHEINALLVPAESPAHIAAAVRRLLESFELGQRLAQTAGEIFEREFELSRSCDRMLSLYRRVAERRGDTRSGGRTATTRAKGRVQ